MTTHWRPQATVKLNNDELVEHVFDLSVACRGLEAAVILNGTFRQLFDALPVNRRSIFLQEPTEQGSKALHFLFESIFLVFRCCLNQIFQFTFELSECVTLGDFMKLLGITWNTRMRPVLWRRRKCWEDQFQIKAWSYLWLVTFSLVKNSNFFTLEGFGSQTTPKIGMLSIIFPTVF